MQFTKREQSKGGGANYLRLKDGESIVGIFRGDIFEFYQTWPSGGQKKVYSSPTQGATSRFKANFLVIEDSAYTAKVFEFGLAIYNLLADLNETYPLSETKVKITRRGEKQSTNYSVFPMPGNIADNEMRAIRQTELRKLDIGPAAIATPEPEFNPQRQAGTVKGPGQWVDQSPPHRPPVKNFAPQGAGGTPHGYVDHTAGSWENTPMPNAEDELPF